MTKRRRSSRFVWTSLLGVGAPSSFLIQLRLVLRRAAVAQRRVQTLAVVEHFNVRVDRPAGLLSGRVVLLVYQLHLERLEKTLHRRVVIAVPAAAHRARDPVPLQDRPVL